MTYVYTIPHIPPSNNRYIGRTNFREYQAEKKRWAMLCQVCCRPVPDQPLDKARVRIVYWFPDRRRRDPDNYSGKMLLDGLVGAGILADDSFGHITLSLEAFFGCDEARTVLEVEEDI